VHLDVGLIQQALRGPGELPALGSAIDVSKARAAAVIVPLRLAPEPAALFVLRASHLQDHAGEVGFPGGKPEPDDADLAATALREMHEEVGVPALDVEIVGTLMPMPVITGRYLIHPFVGVLGPGASPRAASPEIARILELPIVPLLTGDRPIAAVQGEWSGARVFAPHFELDGCVLYGASAYIFYELLSRLAATLGLTMPAPRMQETPPWGKRYG
jgi:8-oxo-dGTP pyrophosphatase MutT (NUDIX family)